LPRWDAPAATRNFAILLVGSSAAVSIFLARSFVPTLANQARDYAALATILYADRSDAIPMVLNPPGWWYVTRRPAIQTPSNGPEAARAATARYGATHLVLEPTVTDAWRAFRQGEATSPDFAMIGEWDGYRIFSVRAGT
jgi:hypothetical protein